MKEKLVGTLLGRIGARGRELWTLWQAVYADPEEVATLSQAYCATRLLPYLCSESNIFLDVGAHFGSVVAKVQRRNRNVRTIAFEADPKKAANLTKRFPNVEVHSCAVGDTNGEAAFIVDKIRPGLSRLTNIEADSEHTISVPIRRLDDLISTESKVDAIKIDVEGGELAALRGGVQLIARSRPAIMFESGPDLGAQLGHPAEDLFDWFANNRYLLFVPNRVAHNGPPLDRAGFIEGHHYPFRTLNYFAIPIERRIEFRDRARVAFGIMAQNDDGA